MRSLTSAALLAAVAFAFVLPQAPANADTPYNRSSVRKPPRYIYYGREDRAPTRLTVRRRSFLDPGSESKPFAQHYSDYAMSPSYTIFPKYFDYSSAPGSWSRMPLPGLYDIPGWNSR